MKSMHLTAAAAALLIWGGCADAGAPLNPAAPELARSAGAPIEVSGEFTAAVDFTTLTLTPRGSNCLLVVDGRLVFSGTIEGTATGTTSALVFAPCSEVAVTPPGTFRDVFTSKLEFEGTVDGEPARAGVLYQGGVQPGGQIEGRIILSRGVQGVLEVDSRVAVGGSYRGSVVVN